MRVPAAAILALLLLAGVGRAAETPSPLRLVPAETDLVLQIEQPRKLVEAISTLDIVKHLQTLDVVKEALDSTQTRRFYQLVAYVEKQLGVDRLELLDRVAGGGAVLASKLGNNAPALFVIQGTDAELTRKFLLLALDILEQELERQGAKVKISKASYHDNEFLSLGKDLHATFLEGALLVSNREDLLKRAIDLGKSKDGKSLAQRAEIAGAMKLLPKQRLASLWLNMEPVKKQPEFEAFYKTPRDPFVTVVFGGLADLLGRTPYLCGALCREDKGLLLTFRLPRGTDGMGADKAVNCPSDGAPGSRPLLQPKGTLFSSSYYWDVSRFWTDRVALFGQERAKDIEKADEQSGAVLSTVSLSKLLTAAGPYQRLVAVRQEKAGYKKQPKNMIPAFAVVLELRKPDDFRKGMEAALRAGGLFATTQLGLKMVEEKRQGYDIIGYRFDEEKELKQDTTDNRFNFSPCFVQVGKQYIFCSTMELCRELVDQLHEEAKGQDKGSPRTSRSVFVSAGGKELLNGFREQLVASAILGQALPLEEAKKQVEAFLALFDRVEGLAIEQRYAAKEFHYDIRLNLKK
jgi:hypothetical protein